MTDKAREEMSALMDGEATELELHRVLKCCEDDEELRASWRRYHVMRSVIRGETRDKSLLAGRSENAAMGFASAVSQAIADEPAYQESTEPHKQRRPWVDTLLRPLGSVAVAASVSAMVIFGWQSTGGFAPSQTAAGTSIASVQTYSVPPSSPTYASSTISPTYVASKATVFNNREPGYLLADDAGLPVVRAEMGSSHDVIRLQLPQDERFNRYILSHSGNAAFNTVSGAIPYARVVTLKPSMRSVK